MALTFVLDENLRGPLWQAILRHNLQGGEHPLNVLRVGDTVELPLSSDDAAVLLWAERQQRLLVTEDRHTMLGHLRDHLASGHHSPGILIMRTEQRMRTLVECLALIAHAGASDDFMDAITYVP